MSLSELCNRSVVVTPAKTAVEEASRLMREQHVGSLVVAEETAREADEPWDTIRVMRERGVRRMPVVGDDGLLVGIVTVDDLLEIIAEQLDGLAKLISAEQTREARSRC